MNIFNFVCYVHDYLGDFELFSAAVPTSPLEQPQGVYQEGSLLDNLQHHCRKPSTNTGVCMCVDICEAYQKLT